MVPLPCAKKEAIMAKLMACMNIIKDGKGQYTHTHHAKKRKLGHLLFIFFVGGRVTECKK